MKGKLTISTVCHHGKTVLKDCYYNPPFKLADITEKNQSILQLMIMSASPGILKNDELCIDICVEENCQLEMQTQSYQRIFTSTEQASQHLNVSLKNNATFLFITHPSVPHKDSSFIARNHFHLQPNSFFIWGEVLTCGRKNNQEIFRFHDYHSITKIYMGDHLMIHENLRMQPDLWKPDSIGQLEQHTHQASFIFYNKGSALEKYKSELTTLLNAAETIRFGITNGPGQTLMVRILGHQAEMLFELLKAMKNKCIATIPSQNSTSEHAN